MSPPRIKKDKSPPWHHDFRMAEHLPDIKAVRTDFIVNVVAFLLAGLLVLSLVYREIRSMGLRDSIASQQAEMAEIKPQHDEIVELNRSFMERKRLYDDIVKFFDEPVDPTGFLFDVADIRPEAVAFQQISFVEEQVTRRVNREEQIRRVYRMNFTGQTKDPQAVEVFKSRLAALPYLLNVETTINEGASTRNPELGTIGFSLRVSFQSAN